MLRLGIIGTNWITAQFVAAARETGEYSLTAIYSRREETAQKFADETRANAELFTNLTAFFASPAFDVVYIASPNSLHAAQAVQALNAGKNVIVEKPMVTNIKQMAGIDAALKANPHLFIFEAARHIYEDNFQRVSKFTHTHPISGATLTYMKYSSKYDAFLSGKNPNVFTTTFDGGAWKTSVSTWSTRRFPGLACRTRPTTVRRFCAPGLTAPGSCTSTTRTFPST
nr:Gfo/Idh/MocA family oxidoreductase [Lacticaseibacillus sharpeae]